MKRLVALAFVLAAVGSLVAQTKKEITLEDIWLKGTFRPKFVSEFNFTPDGNFYTAINSAGAVGKYAIVGADSLLLYNPAKIKDAKPAEDYSFAKGNDKLMLIGTGIQQIYRRSTKGVYYVYNADANTLQPVDGTNNIMYPQFSPNGNAVAYVKDNNMFVLNRTTGATTQVTTDGELNGIINGAADWVYEEEFAISKAYQWSPDGSKLAYIKFDESKVPQYSMDMYGSLYPEPYTFKYPKAGEANAKPTLWVYDVATAKTTEIDLGQVRDYYIPRIAWVPQTNTLMYVRMNRQQNQLDMLYADIVTGKSQVMYTENSNAYIDIHEGDGDFYYYTANGKQFLLSSEKSGYNQLYLYDVFGKLIKQVTTANADVEKVVAIDEKNSVIYYTAFEGDALNTSLYSIKFDGTKQTKLSPNAGHNSAQISPNFKYYIITNSNANTPPATTMYDAKGAVVKVLEDNKALKDRMAEFAMQPKEFTTIKTDNGQTLNAWTIKPPNFDEKKKYPVLMYVYGGPGSQTVSNDFQFSWYFWHQLMAAKGYIIVSVDGRGTGGRGSTFKKATYRELGKYETEDQIAAANYFAKLPYVDATRIGIHGWSFGGYMSSLCITKGAGVFKSAIAVAPVTNWRFYDSIYTERFLDTPQNNPSGYDDNSPINHVNKLKGNYLLIHGTADDNVHFQNAVEMVDALVKANKQFDTMYYPNRNHGIYGGTTRYHLYKLMTDWLVEKL